MRKTLFGAGGSLMLASVGLFASGWPQFITAHVWMVWTVMAVGMLLFAGGFLVPTDKPSGAIPAQSARAESKVGGDVAQTTEGPRYGDYAPQANPVFAPVFNNTFPIAPPVAQPETPPPTIPEKPSYPYLALRKQVRWIKYHDNPGKWCLSTQSDPEAKLSILLFVSNPAPTERNKSGLPAIGVVVQLKIESIMPTLNIPRAYWLDFTYNQLDIGVGYEYAAILSYFDGHFFKCNENGYQMEGLNQYFDVPLRFLGQPHLAGTVESIKIHISLLENGHRLIERASVTILMPERLVDMEILP